MSKKLYQVKFPKSVEFECNSETATCQELCERASAGECPIPIKNDVVISGQHAHSLAELVKYFKGMIETGNIPESPGRSDELTIGYCDELLEDLNQCHL